MSYFNDSASTDRDDIRNAHHTQHNPVSAPRRVAREYPMTHKPRGRALIFNHEIFNPNLNLHQKKGTREDQERLETILRNLGFLTEAYNDLKHEEIKKKIHEVSKEQNSNYDCLVVVVMTHGNKLNEVKKQMPRLFASDEEYHESELWTPFNNESCRTYCAKPKLFFLQVCTDDEKDAVLSDGKAQRKCQDKAEKPKTIPENSDFLIVRSFYQDCPSFRNSQEHSIFIEKLCEELEKDHRRKNSKKKEINKILLTLHGTASEAPRTSGGNPDDTEDPLMFTTEKSLTRKLFFRNVD